MVVTGISWPHEVVGPTLAGKPASYEGLSIPLFVQGYRNSEKEAVRAKIATHLDKLMGDADLDGWERVRAYHRVWHKQMEQG